MIRLLAKLGFQFVIWLAYRAYKAEGVNALLLLMPAKLVVPTLRKYGAQIGERVEIHSPLLIHNASVEPGLHYAHLNIGNDCYFGRDVFFDLKDEIRIESNVTVSMRATLITHTDVGKSPMANRMSPSHAPVVLRRGAYVGTGATILEGVEIGEQAVIGAGAVVTKQISPYIVAVGVPARMIASAINFQFPVSLEQEM